MSSTHTVDAELYICIALLYLISLLIYLLKQVNEWGPYEPSYVLSNDAFMTCLKSLSFFITLLYFIYFTYSEFNVNYALAYGLSIAISFY